MLSEKKYYSAGVFSVLLALSLIRFLIFYLPNYVFGSTETWAYVIRFSEVVFGMVLPLLIAAEAFFTVRGGDIRRGCVRVTVMSLSTVVYNLPYYYLFSVSLEITSDKSILWGALAAVALVLVGALHSLLLFLVMRFAARGTVAAAVRERLPRVFSGEIPRERLGEWRCELAREVDSRLGEGGIFSFDSPAPFAMLCASACQFIYSFGLELYNVIDYLVSYSGAYRSGEILYMIFSLVFILAMLFVCQAAAVGVGKIVMLGNKSKKYEE